MTFFTFLRFTEQQNMLQQPSKLNFSFGGHLATNSLGLVAKGFF